MTDGYPSVMDKALGMVAMLRSLEGLGVLASLVVFMSCGG